LAALALLAVVFFAAEAFVVVVFFVAPFAGKLRA
jgi:hypothetical protein